MSSNLNSAETLPLKMSSNMKQMVILVLVLVLVLVCCHPAPEALHWELVLVVVLVLVCCQAVCRTTCGA